MSDRELNPVTKQLLVAKDKLSTEDKWCPYRLINDKGQMCIHGAVFLHLPLDCKGKGEKKLLELLIQATNQLYPQYKDEGVYSHVAANNELGFSVIHPILDRAITLSMEKSNV